jgi:hypothetical protein
MRARIRRIRMLLFRGSMKQWNELNCQALSKLRAKFDPVILRTLDNFISARTAVPFTSPQYKIRQSGVYRQTLLTNIAYCSRQS